MMRQVAAFAFKRPTTAWLLITDDEWRRLDGLEAWTVKLFCLLLVCSDFKTGHGRTGYGELITGLTPDQPPSGPRLWAPSRNDVKKALYAFERAGLVVVDRVASELRKALFFHVPPRTRKDTPARKQNPELNPTSTEVKQVEFDPTTAPGDSEKNSLKPRAQRPVDNSTSTPPAATRERLRQVRSGIAARGDNRAPKGA